MSGKRICGANEQLNVVEFAIKFVGACGGFLIRASARDHRRCLATLPDQRQEWIDLALLAYANDRREEREHILLSLVVVLAISLIVGALHNAPVHQGAKRH